MIDSSGNRITEKIRKKNMTSNELFKTINRKLKTVGMSLKEAYILDGRLVVYIKPQNEYSFAIYVDNFKSDNKHAAVRLVLENPKKSWYTTKAEVDEYIKLVNKHSKILDWMREQDFSQLYAVSEKEDTVLDDGKFTFSNTSYTSTTVGEIVKYLQDYYKEERVYGCGFKNKDRIVVLTDDIAYAKGHFAPARFDLHIFNLDGSIVKTKPHVISHGHGSYSDFFVEGILNDDGNTIEVALRHCVNPGFSKCHDEFYAYGTINSSLIFNCHPFIFSDRHSEKHISFKEDFESGCFSYKYTSEELPFEKAIEESKKM